MNKNKEKNKYFLEEVTDKMVMDGQTGRNKCTGYISVSDVKTMVTTPFDSENVASGLVERYYNDSSSRYYQQTKEQILASWDKKAKQSLHYGQLLDKCAEKLLENDVNSEEDFEMFLLDNNYDDDSQLQSMVGAMQDFLNLLETKHGSDYEFIGREIPVAYEIGDNSGKYVKGRIDALFYNKKTNKYIIIDWKSDDRLEEIPNKWTVKCLGPAADYYQLNYYTYTMQLYSYKLALLQSWLTDKTEDDIQVFICNCPKVQLTGEQRKFKLFQPAFDLNKEQMDKIYDFAFKKKSLLWKKQCSEAK